MLGDGGRLWAVWLLPFAAAVWPGGTSRSGAVAALYCWCRCGHPSLRRSSVLLPVADWRLPWAKVGTNLPFQVVVISKPDGELHSWICLYIE